MLLPVNCMEFYRRDCGSVHYHTNWSPRFVQKAACHRLRKVCRLQLEHKAATVACVSPTRCWRNKHLARPDTNQNKCNEIVFLPYLFCLLTNESAHRQYKLQKGDDSALKWTYYQSEDRGSAVVKVLCNKSEGCWFDLSWCHWHFSLT